MREGAVEELRSAGLRLHVENGAHAGAGGACRGGLRLCA